MVIRPAMMIPPETPAESATVYKLLRQPSLEHVEDLDSRHVEATFMEEEDVRNCQRSNTLSCACEEAHEDSGGKLTPIALRNTRPNRSDGIAGKRDYIDWSSSILYNQRHPDDIAGTLQEGGGGEEVCNFGDGRREFRQSWWNTSERYGDVDNSHSRAGSQEVTEKHCSTHQECEIDPITFRPVQVGQKNIFRSG